MTGLVTICMMLGFYFLPTIIAASRKHNNVGVVAVVNTFFGWTLVGWAVALAWCFSDNVKKSA